MKWRMNDIENFMETAGCQTIVQAARKLEISQPALSESLKRLEEDTGAQLFYRSRTGIQLTPSGRIFLKKAKALMDKVRELDLSAESQSVFNGQSIVIGAHPTVAQYTIPKALPLIEAQAPDFKIELRHDLSRNIQSDIQRGTIDIGVVVNPIRVPDIVILKVATDLVAVWESKNNSKSSVICNTNLFQTQAILKRWKNKPERLLSTESLELICQITNEGGGYGVLPERAVLLSGLPLKMIKSLPSYQDEICLVFRPEFGKTTPERLVLEALKQSLTK